MDSAPDDGAPHRGDSSPGVSLRSSAAWNAAFGYLTILVALVRNVAFVPIYLHYIPVDEFGVWLATGGALIGIFLTDFGLSGALTQRASQFLGAADYARLGTTIVAGLLASALLAIVLTAAALVLAPAVPLFGTLSPQGLRRALWCFEIAIVAGGIAILNAALMGLLRSLHRPVVAGLAAVVADVMSVVVTLLLIFNGYGLYALAWGLLARSLLTLIWTTFGLRAELKCRAAVQLRLDRLEFRTLLSGSVFWFTASISMKLQANSNTVVVAATLGPTVAAAYGLTVRAHETLQALLVALSHAVSPSMAHLYGAGNIGRLRDVSMRLVVVLAGLTALGMAVTVSCNEAFVSVWVGHNLYAGFAVSALMGLAIWIAVLGHVGYDAVQARGDFRTIAGIYAATALLHVVVLYGLTRFGAWGAPAASVISALACAAAFWRRVERMMPSTQQQRAELARTFAGIIVVGLSVVVLGALLPLPSAITWLGFIGRGVVASALGLLGMTLAAPRAVAVFSGELRATLRRR